MRKGPEREVEVYLEGLFSGLGRTLGDSEAGEVYIGFSQLEQLAFSCDLPPEDLFSFGLTGTLQDTGLLGSIPMGMEFDEKNGCLNPWIGSLETQQWYTVTFFNTIELMDGR